MFFLCFSSNYCIFSKHVLQLVHLLHANHVLPNGVHALQFMVLFMKEIIVLTMKIFFN